MVVAAGSGASAEGVVRAGVNDIDVTIRCRSDRSHGGGRIGGSLPPREKNSWLAKSNQRSGVTTAMAGSTFAPANPGRLGTDRAGREARTDPKEADRPFGGGAPPSEEAPRGPASARLTRGFPRSAPSLRFQLSAPRYPLPATRAWSLPGRAAQPACSRRRPDLVRRPETCRNHGLPRPSRKRILDREN